MARNAIRLVWAAATPMEMEAVLSGLGVSVPMPGQGRSSSACWQGRECFFLVTGVGPVLAALNFGFFLGQTLGKGQTVASPPLAVVNAGIAGSFCTQKAPLGSLALANAEAWPEYGVAVASGVDARTLGFPLLAGSGDGQEAIWERMALDPGTAFAAMGLTQPESCVPGLSLTVAGVSGDPARASVLRERYNPLTENMEGFSLALACRCSHLPFVELRAISNLVGERDKSAWDVPGALLALAQGIRQAASQWQA